MSGFGSFWAAAARRCHRLTWPPRSRSYLGRQVSTSMVMSGGYRLKDRSMPVPRRFLIASSLARLIQREGRPATRLVEAYFPPRADRTLLVRVEHGRASLILRSSGPDGQIGEEAVEVPLSHAEALVEVANGTVAFDRLT